MFLKNYVEELLETELDHLLTGHPKQPTLPLVRVRVFYSEDRHTLLPGKFGNHFDKRAANPSDILLFKKLTRERKKEDTFDNQAAAEVANSRVDQSMEALIEGYFQTADDKNQLRVLTAQRIATAVDHFIEKGNKEAIHVVVQKQYEKTLQHVMDRELAGGDDPGIDDALADYAVERKERNVNEAEEVREELLGPPLPPRTTGRVSNGFARNEATDEDEEREDSRGARGRGRGRARAAGRGGGRGTRGGRGRGRGTKDTPTEQNTIANAFARQTQSQSRSSSRRKTPVLYADSDDE